MSKNNRNERHSAAVPHNRYALRVVGGGRSDALPMIPPLRDYATAWQTAERLTRENLDGSDAVLRVSDLATGKLMLDDWDTWLLRHLFAQNAQGCIADQLAWLMRTQRHVIDSAMEVGGAEAAVVLIDPLDDRGAIVARRLGRHREKVLADMDSRLIAALPLEVTVAPAHSISGLVGVSVPPRSVVVCGFGGVHVLPVPTDALN